MVHCNQCGKENQDNTVFCEFCGAQIITLSGKTPPQSAMDMTQRVQAPQQSAPVYNGYAQNSQEQVAWSNAGKKGDALKIVLPILAGVLLGVVIFTLTQTDLFRKKEESDGDTSQIATAAEVSSATQDSAETVSVQEVADTAVTETVEVTAEAEPMPEVIEKVTPEKTTAEVLSMIDLQETELITATGGESSPLMPGSTSNYNGLSVSEQVSALSMDGHPGQTSWISHNGQVIHMSWTAADNLTWNDLAALLNNASGRTAADCSPFLTTPTLVWVLDNCTILMPQSSPASFTVETARYIDNTGGAYLDIIGGIQAPASDFILPQSSSAYLTEADISAKCMAGTVWDNKKVSQLAANEMFARYGFHFTGKTDTSQDAIRAFADKAWYQRAKSICPYEDWADIEDYMMTDLEKANTKMLTEWQKKYAATGE